MNRQTPHQLIHSADATQEYRGPVVEVLTDVSVELLPDESVDVRPMPSPASPSMIAQSMRRTTLSPVAVDANASMEFPHPVAPELFADGTGELFPDLDETLPPAPRHTAPRRPLGPPHHRQSQGRRIRLPPGPSRAC